MKTATASHAHINPSDEAEVTKLYGKLNFAVPDAALVAATVAADAVFALHLKPRFNYSNLDD